MAGSLAIQAALAFPDPSRVRQREAEVLKRSVDSFIATESPIALNNMLCNIGAQGACASGANAGIVVASPDKTNPDCEPFLFLILIYSLLPLRNPDSPGQASNLEYLKTFIHGHVTLP